MRCKPFAVLGPVALASSLAAAQSFSLVIDPGASGLEASVEFAADTRGDLIGDWDPDTNPAGTRTKPGLFGGFGSTENLPVDLTLGLGLSGDLDTRTAGSLTLTLDVGAGVVTIEGLAADLLAGGPAAVGASVRLEPDDFRTRQPESVYFGVPFELPIGEISVTGLTLTQTAAAVGVLTEIGPGLYEFAVVGAGEIAGTFDLLGTPTEIPPTPTPLTLAGEIEVVGGRARLTSVQPIDQSDVQTPGEPLPEFPLDLPTILPPGETAHLLLHLVLEETSASLLGRLSLVAEGDEASCLADFNGDGAVNTLDFIAFLGAWSAGESGADVNGDGAVNTLDFIEFLNLWVAGC